MKTSSFVFFIILYFLFAPCSYAQENLRLTRPIDLKEIYYFHSPDLHLGYGMRNLKALFHGKSYYSQGSFFLPHISTKSTPVLLLGYRIHTWEIDFSNGITNLSLTPSYKIEDKLYQNLSVEINELGVLKLWEIINNRLSFYTGVAYAYVTERLESEKSDTIRQSYSQSDLKLGFQLYTKYHLLVGYGYTVNLSKQKKEWIDTCLSVFILL